MSCQSVSLGSPSEIFIALFHYTSSTLWELLEGRSTCHLTVQDSATRFCVRPLSVRTFSRDLGLLSHAQIRVTGYSTLLLSGNMSCCFELVLMLGEAPAPHNPAQMMERCPCCLHYLILPSDGNTGMINNILYSHIAIRLQENDTHLTHLCKLCSYHISPSLPFYIFPDHYLSHTPFIFQAAHPAESH